eukprot:10423674-Lingulodinium_polyedra.AAC.1
MRLTSTGRNKAKLGSDKKGSYAIPPPAKRWRPVPPATAAEDRRRAAPGGEHEEEQEPAEREVAPPGPQERGRTALGEPGRHGPRRGSGSAARCRHKA